MLNLRSVEQAKSLKQALTDGGSSGRGGDVSSWRIIDLPSLAENDKTEFLPARSARATAKQNQPNKAFSATSAISADEFIGNSTFTVLINPDQEISTGQKIDAYMVPCELVPEDKEFLLHLLPTETKLRKMTIARYKTEWLAGMGNESRNQCKQNKGRHKANTWLRENTQPR